MPGPPAFFRCHVPFLHMPLPEPATPSPPRPPIDLSTLHPPASPAPIAAARGLAAIPGPSSLFSCSAQCTLDGLADCSIIERTGRTRESSEVSPSAPESRIPILRLFMRFFRELPTSGLVPTGNLRSSLFLLHFAHNPAQSSKGPFASLEPLRVIPRPPAVPSPYHPAPDRRLRFSRGLSRGQQVTPSHQC